MEIFFLIIILIVAGAILFLCKKRNAQDILAFNTLLGIVSLFIIGLISNDKEVWLKIVSFLGVVATGSAFASTFFRGRNERQSD